MYAVISNLLETIRAKKLVQSINLRETEKAPFYITNDYKSQQVLPRMASFKVDLLKTGTTYNKSSTVTSTWLLTDIFCKAYVQITEVYMLLNFITHRLYNRVI